MLGFINILLTLFLISCKPAEQITMNIPIAELVEKRIEKYFKMGTVKETV